MQPTIPDAVAEAIAQLKRHPGLQSVQEPKILENGRISVEMQVAVSLPSRAKAEGVSTTGVKAIEPLVLLFKPDFPLSAPRPFLRVDFPLNLAHIYVHRPGMPVSPCIYEGSLDELFQQDGLEGVIEQSCDWLAKAASGQLIDLSQGWEPMRRDSCAGVFEFDADQAEKLLPADGQVLYVPSNFFVADTTSYFQLKLDKASLKLSLFVEAAGQKGTAVTTGVTSTLLVQAPWVDGSPVIFNTYKPDTVVDLPTLLAQAGELGIDGNSLRSQIETALSHSVNASTKNWRAFHLAVVLAVHRPVPLIGANGRTVEFLPYLLSIDGFSTKPDISICKVGAVYHVHTLSPGLLARTSGIPTDRVAQGVTFLGCGSLGSKIAFHLGRAGFGKCRFVDNEMFSPHNTARHALLPTPGSMHTEKAFRMVDSFSALGHENTVGDRSDITKLLSTTEGLSALSELTAGSALVLDTTASLTVARAASSPSAFAADGPRFARAMLYGKGRASVVMMEGPNRLPRADDLSASLFALCRKNRALREALAGGERDGEELFVGDNCRSLTMVMPDSVISRNAAQISMQLEEWLLDGFPQEGCLAVGHSQAGKISSNWESHPIGIPTILASTGDDGWSIRVAESAALAIDAQSRHWGRLETGGVLLGNIDAFNKTIVIADLIDAPPDSLREPARFVLGTQGLSMACRAAHSDSIGYLGYVGTWHSHPMGGQHSQLDFKTLNTLASLALGEPRVSLVWTPDGLRCAIDRSDREQTKKLPTTGGDLDDKQA